MSEPMSFPVTETSSGRECGHDTWKILLERLA